MKQRMIRIMAKLAIGTLGVLTVLLLGQPIPSGSWLDWVRLGIMVIIAIGTSVLMRTIPAGVARRYSAE